MNQLLQFNVYISITGPKLQKLYNYYRCKSIRKIVFTQFQELSLLQSWTKCTSRHLTQTVKLWPRCRVLTPYPNKEHFYSSRIYKTNMHSFVFINLKRTSVGCRVCHMPKTVQLCALINWNGSPMAFGLIFMHTHSSRHRLCLKTKVRVQ